MRKTINENKMAREIALKEGKKKSTDIAQVKEVQKLTLEYLAKQIPSQVLALIEKHGD